MEGKGLKDQLDISRGNYNKIDDRLDTRLESLSDLHPMIISLPLKFDNRKKVLESYKKVIQVLNCQSEKNILDTTLMDEEISIIDCIISQLGENTAQKLMGYYSQAKSETFGLGNLLARVFEYYLQENAAMTFGVYWESKKLSKIIKHFGIEDNFFSQNFAKIMICGIQEGDNIIIPEKLRHFINYLFAKFRDFAFIKNVSLIYPMLPPEGKINEKRLRFECTQISNRFKDHPDSIKPGDAFYINGTGQIIEAHRNLQMPQLNIIPTSYINGSFRGDRLVVFGKHPSADIRFHSEDPTVDDISLVISCSENGYFAIDCMVRNSSIKLAKEFASGKDAKYKLAVGMVFNLSQFCHFAIKKIEYFQEPYENNSIQHSNLFFEYIDGPYFSEVDNHCIKLSTFVQGQKELKRRFTVGKGGASSIDVFALLENYVSSKHFEFEFSQEQEWFIRDLDSKNGTFKLLKNRDQFERKEHSQPIKISPEEANYVTLKISNYVFFITDEPGK